MDRCLLLFFPGPRSYTGEDVAEFQLHGSPYVLQKALELTLQAGARAARPGEFTERAFLNGRMDLSQAEGVMELIASTGRASARASLAQMDGALSLLVRAFCRELVHVTAAIQASLDYPDEEETSLQQDVGAVMDSLLPRVSRLLDTWQQGQRMRSGARVALAGVPNAGKSSLMNCLALRDRSIVTDRSHG